jgi:NADPH:quinone reductase-like Zn-dependent oxidoreductase
MKVLQVDAPGGQFTLLDVPTPQPGPGQVLLRVEAVTTCPQWDLHLRHNEPMFVGHRFDYPYAPGAAGTRGNRSDRSDGNGRHRSCRRRPSEHVA